MLKKVFPLLRHILITTTENMVEVFDDGDNKVTKTKTMAMMMATMMTMVNTTTRTIMMMMAALTKYGYSSRKTSSHSPWTWPVAFPHDGDE